MPVTLRSFTDFILQSRLRTIGIAFAVTFIPLIGTISIIIAALITLRKGALEGFWILIASTLPYVLLLPFQAMPIGLWLVGIITITNVLTWLFAILLYRYGNWNLILELATLIGIIAITSAHIAKPDLEIWWGKQLNTYLTQIVSANDSVLKLPNKLGTSAKIDSSHEISEENTEPEIISFIDAAKPYATGIATASLLFTALLQIFIARWWQTSLSESNQLRQELYHIRLSQMAGFVFLIAIILSHLKIVLAQDMLPVLYLAFCIAGLSLVHYAISKFKTFGWLWLILFYSVLLSSWMVYRLPLVFQLVAMIALLDVWFDWRERLDKKFP